MNIHDNEIVARVWSSKLKSIHGHWTVYYISATEAQISHLQAMKGRTV